MVCLRCVSHKGSHIEGLIPVAGPILEILETSGERDYQEGGLEVCFQGPFLIPKSVSVFLQNLFCLGAVLFFRLKVKEPTGMN